MKQLPVQIASWNSRSIVRAIENVCVKMGLRQTLKGTLRTYPGCIHWHFKKGRLAGTLEVTLWPDEQRVWLSVQSGRAADWINETLAPLQAALEQKLSAPRTEQQNGQRPRGSLKQRQH